MRSYTYDDTDLVDQTNVLRLLIGDTDVSGGSAMAAFSDEECDKFIALEGASLYFAAALALRALSADKSRLAVKVKALGTETDATKVAKELRDTADKYDEQGEAAVAAGVVQYERLDDQVLDSGVDLSERIADEAGDF